VRVTVSPAAGGDQQVLEADKLLSAIGFAPRTEGYGLEATGVALTERGAIAIDDYCRTNVPGVYAIGDCTAKMMLAHVAEAMGIVAAETIAGAETMPSRLRLHPAGDLLPPADRLVRLLRGAGQGEGLRRQDGDLPLRRQRQGQGLGRRGRLRQGRRRREHNEILGAAHDRPRRHRAAAGAQPSPRSGTSPPTSNVFCPVKGRLRPPDPVLVARRSRRPSTASTLGHMINF
jgi:dihydrolipoamide dehydrogenase